MMKFNHLWKFLLGGTCAMLLSGAGFSAENPVLTFHEFHGHYQIEGSFYINTDQQSIWNVLTDYNHIPRFVGNMKISRVESRSGNDLVLHQELEGGFLFFTQRVHLTLNVHETPESSIVFSDTSHVDFKFYQGSWRINPSPTGHGFDVVYDLDAQQSFSAPAFLASDAMHGGAQDLLRKVRQEILRRQELLSHPTPLIPPPTLTPRLTPPASIGEKEEKH